MLSGNDLAAAPQEFSSSLSPTNIYDAQWAKPGTSADPLIGLCPSLRPSVAPSAAVAQWESVSRLIISAKDSTKAQTQLRFYSWSWARETGPAYQKPCLFRDPDPAGELDKGQNPARNHQFFLLPEGTTGRPLSFSEEAMPRGEIACKAAAEGMLDSRKPCGWQEVESVQRTHRDLQYYLVLVSVQISTFSLRSHWFLNLYHRRKYSSLSLHFISERGNCISLSDKINLRNTRQKAELTVYWQGGRFCARAPYLKYFLSGYFDAAMTSLGLLKRELVSEDLQFLD